MDTDLFDIALTADLKLFFHLIFNWQPVAIPAETTVNKIPAHGPVARHNIFNGSGQQMAIMRQSGCKRRTVIKNISFI